MSAFMVSKQHIDHMVAAAIKQNLIEPADADETGRMLWNENLKSLKARYPGDGDGERPGPVDFRDRHVTEYVFTSPGIDLTPGGVAKTVGCYSYQSCEHRGWEASEAFALCQKMVPEKIPYDDSVPWGW